MSDLLATWAAITDWLAIHAPASHAAVRPNVTEDAVRSAEEQLGVVLPFDLVKLLMVCDGTVDSSVVDRDPDEYDPGLFFAQHHLLPLDAIVQVRGSGDAADQFCGPWVPFAVADHHLAPWDGQALEPGGRLAVFQQASGEPPSESLTIPGSVSLREFLSAVAEALTRGTGPLMAEAVPGFHKSALAWGRWRATMLRGRQRTQGTAEPKAASTSIRQR